MNQYYSAPQTPVDFTVAKSKQVRGQWAALEAAFDKLDGRTSFIVAGGTANDLTATMGFPPEAYAEGLVLLVKITTTNTGPATMNVNGLGPVEIVTRVNDPLVAGDLLEGSVETMFYVDGRFMIREVAGAQGPVGPQGPPDGPQGEQGEQGPQGEAGEDGRTVLNGTVDPVEGDGLDGDFYINTTSWQVFGPKTAGAWGTGTDLIGEQGPQGIQGTPGAQGPQGATGPAGTDGADGAGSTWGDLGGKPAKLTNFAGLAGGANKLPYFNGADSMAQVDITSFARTLLGAANLTELGQLGALTLVDAFLGSPGWLRVRVGTGGVFTIMWGTANIAGNGLTTVFYPDGGFSTFSVAVCSAPGHTNSDARDNGPGVLSASANSFTVSNAYDNTRTTQWIAVGV